MSEETTFTTGSLQTFVAGAFIVALLALGLSIYNTSLTKSAVSALLDLQATAVVRSGNDDAMSEHEAHVAALETRIKALEDAAAATASAIPTPP